MNATPEPSDAIAGTPPKYMRRQVRRLQLPDEEELLPSEALLLTRSEDALAGPPGAGELAVAARTLPVLRAFQEFLEHERRRARNRMLFLTVFFAFVLAAVVAAGIFVATFFMGQTRGDVDELRSRLSDAQASAAAALDTIGQETARIREQIRAERETLVSASTGMASRLDDYSADLARLDEVISMLRLESATLRGDVDDLRLSRQPAPPAAPAAGPVAATAPTPPEIVGAVITPRGAASSYAWRFTLPASVPRGE